MYFCYIGLSGIWVNLKLITSKLKLKNLLWIDFLLGFVTGVIGISFFRSLETLLKVPYDVIAIISVVTLVYSILALFLAQQNVSGVKLTRSLIIANWLWSVVSVILLYLYFSNASLSGKLFLILQVIVVAGLAYFEGRALKQLENNYR
jgi:hypothetical protein